MIGSALYRVQINVKAVPDKHWRAIGSNWKLATSYRYLSGAFLSASTGVDRALNGSGNQRPDQILANPLCDNPRPTCWINPAAFAQPAFGTLGNSGRSSIPGPTYFSIDSALSRVFVIREGKTVEVRAEAFNLTNSFRSNAPSTNRSSPQFGQILTAQDPRIMQVAAKFFF